MHFVLIITGLSHKSYMDSNSSAVAIQFYYFDENKRLFDVRVDDDLIFEEYDIVKAANGSRTATRLTTTKTISDGNLMICLVHRGVDNPKISGVEVQRIA